MNELGREIIIWAVAWVGFFLCGSMIYSSFREVREAKDKIKWLTERFPIKAPLLVTGFGGFLLGLLFVVVIGIDLFRRVFIFLFK